jgi:hypothetical protein
MTGENKLTSFGGGKGLRLIGGGAVIGAVTGFIIGSIEAANDSLVIYIATTVDIILGMAIIGALIGANFAGEGETHA